MPEYNIEELNRLIRNRRSIYPNVFSDEVIPDNIIENMLENANWAPNHGITEPWRFTVFTGEGIKKLATFQSSLYKEKSTQEGSFDEGKFKKLAEKPLKCSHIISIGMQRPETEKFPEVEEIEAVACAVQNMYLTAAAYGVGCYWGSGGVTYWPEAKAFFNLGERDKLLGFLYCGMPRIGWPEGRRGSIQKKVQWVNH